MNHGSSDVSSSHSSSSSSSSSFLSLKTDYDIEDLHLLALQNGQSSYEDPTTGFTVFTELLHLKRGTCCGNECRHCPYGYENIRQRRKNQILEEGGTLPIAICSSGDKETATKIVDSFLEGDLGILSLTNQRQQQNKTATTTTNGTTMNGDLALATLADNGVARRANRMFSTTTKNVPYTRKGDAGTSQLGTGERRLKCDCNFEALGCVDELCTFVGVAHASLDVKTYDYGPLPEQLLDVMSRLFDVGSHVAKPRVMTAEGKTTDGVFKPNGIGDGFDEDHIDDLELWINEMTDALPELTSFILPTGATAAAQLHVARTVCRRAERRVVPLVVDDKTCDPNALKYLNRLSDYFFVAARWVNYCEGHDEIEYRREIDTKQRERVHRPLK
jgi:ATP:cob(I)alamin adenosyltransferase